MRYNRKARELQWRIDRIAAGICCACGNGVGEGRRGKQQCQPCQDRASELSKLRRRERRAAEAAKRPLRTCAASDCEVRFQPHNPHQSYCAPSCFYRERSRKRAEAARGPIRPMPRSWKVEGDYEDDVIEQRIKDAYAQIQRERQAGLRPCAADLAWQRTIDPVQAANSGAAYGPTETKHAAQAVSPKAPRRAA